MKRFEYLKADNLKAAFKILKQNTNIKILAAGTDLLVQIKDQMLMPEKILDISFIKELKYIKVCDGDVKIGALATHDMVNKSKEIKENGEVLAMACGQVGSPQIRNRGTIGGNISNASPAADSLPALFVLDADCCLVSESGERRVKITEFFTGPGKTVMKPGELVKGVSFKPVKGWHSKFIKVAGRKSLAISKLSSAAVFNLEGDTIKDVRVAFGAVGPTCIRGEQTETYLTGKNKKEIEIDQLKQKVFADISPISDLRSTKDYRKQVSAVLVKKMLEDLI